MKLFQIALTLALTSSVAWLNHINSLRPANDKLSLTSKETQHGIPIDQANEYNVPLIQQKFTNLRPQIPQVMQDVLFSNKPFTDTPPVEVKAYLDASRELDRIYQSALRWRMMAGYLDYLQDRRHLDVRGWWFLSRMSDRADKLHAYSRQDPALQANLHEWLVGLCFNNDESATIESCNADVDSQLKSGADLEAYYQSKAGAAADIYNQFFLIPDGVARENITWESGDKPRLTVPFTDPGKDDIRHFLQDNIQDEWRFQNWHLELPFSNISGIPHVEFKPGITPHVNTVGGDTIFMNATQPITEYDAQWTIRHEFGHVLGFLDCYVEFYVKERNVIVNYQFDVDNLMCSRRGHIQSRHVTELERVYKK